MKPGIFATIGTFDGVHRGHRFLVSRLKELAAEASLVPACLVITSHPLALIAPERVPPRLSTFEMRRASLESMGVRVIPLHFDEQMRSLTSEQFMTKIVDEFGVKGLLIGHDNRFGSDRTAGFADYLEYGRRLGIIVEEAPVLKGISSSAVRKALLAGKAREAAQMLGRPYRLEGRVVHGAHLGTGIGFPTANLSPFHREILVPGSGVYITRVGIEGYEQSFAGVTNIGVRPTVSGSLEATVSIETFIKDFKDDIYSRAISLDFIDKIRDERRFDSLESLKRQISLDAAKAILC